MSQLSTFSPLLHLTAMTLKKIKNQTGANAQGAVFSGSEMPHTRIFSAGINFKF